MLSKPEMYNCTQLPEDHEEDLVDRMSRSALLCINGLSEDAWEILDSDEALDSDADVDLRVCLDSQTAETVARIEQTGLQLKFHEADVGRGAGGVGVAVEVVEAIATLGGASAAIALAARSVRTAYHKIAGTSGRRPLISLGAAEHLAIADLIDRVESTPQLVGSGDMCSVSVDRAFTGGDAFFVVLAAGSQLHHYHVSDYGELFYIGTSPRIRHHMDEPPPYWAGGDAVED